MREIKFRAWLGHWFEYWDGNDHDDHSAYTVFAAHQEGRADPEQYTGLKDKNGVEIYEGDVVTDPHYRNRQDKLLKIEFQLDQFGGLTKSYDWIPASNLSDLCEVIGNIHENPELLK